MANRRNLTNNKSNKNKSNKNKSNKNKSNKNKSNKNKSNKNKSNKGSRRMRGGMSPVHDMSMAMGQKDSLSQGTQFLDIHKNQHGGMSPYPGGVTGSVLTDSSMVAAARTVPLDSALRQIQGMQDGGARRNRKKNKTRGRKEKRGHSRRNRMRGGAHNFSGSLLSENSMLLPSGLEKSAGLNYDWDAARNPNYWAPKP
jgi:hypothetical protein